jgi:hypothetical protein
MSKQLCFPLCVALWIAAMHAIASPAKAATDQAAAPTSQPALVAFPDDMPFIGGPGTPRAVFANAFSIPVTGDPAPSHLHYGNGGATEFGFESSDGSTFFAVRFYKTNDPTKQVSQTDLQAAAIDQAQTRWRGLLTAGTSVEPVKNSKYLVELHYTPFLHDRLGHFKLQVVVRWRKL